MRLDHDLQALGDGLADGRGLGRQRVGVVGVRIDRVVERIDAPFQRSLDGVGAGRDERGKRVVVLVGAFVIGDVIEAPVFPSQRHFGPRKSAGVKPSAPNPYKSYYGMRN